MSSEPRVSRRHRLSPLRDACDPDVYVQSHYAFRWSRSPASPLSAQASLVRLSQSHVMDTSPHQASASPLQSPKALRAIGARSASPRAISPTIARYSFGPVALREILERNSATIRADFALPSWHRPPAIVNASAPTTNDAPQTVDHARRTVLRRAPSIATDPKTPAHHLQQRDQMADANAESPSGAAAEFASDCDNATAVVRSSASAPAAALADGAKSTTEESAALAPKATRVRAPVMQIKPVLCNGQLDPLLPGRRMIAQMSTKSKDQVDAKWINSLQVARWLDAMSRARGI